MSNGDKLFEPVLSVSRTSLILSGSIYLISLIPSDGLSKSITLW